MATRKVLVADQATHQHKMVDVDLDRYLALDGYFRSSEGMRAAGLGVPGDAVPLIGRRTTAADDQAAVAFLVSQLAYVEQGLFERYYTPMQYDKFLAGCLDFSAGDAAPSIEYEVYDRVGNAQDVSETADDTPFADVAYARKSFPVVGARAGYRFTQQELRAAALLRKPLPERRMTAAMEMYQRKLNYVGLLGNTAKNITGLFNNASIPHAVRPSGNAWTGAATVAQILSDVGFGLYTAWLGSGFNTVPNALLIPPYAYQYISTTPASPTIPTITILQFIKMNNLCKDVSGQELDISPAYDAATAGASNSGRAIFYPRDPGTLIMHVPMPLRFLAPEYRGVEVQVHGEFRYSGVEVRRPANCYYMDGVQ